MDSRRVHRDPRCDHGDDDECARRDGAEHVGGPSPWLMDGSLGSTYPRDTLANPRQNQVCVTEMLGRANNSATQTWWRRRIEGVVSVVERDRADARAELCTEAVDDVVDQLLRRPIPELHRQLGGVAMVPFTHLQRSDRR